MKKILAILISVVGLNAYAGLNLTNVTSWYLAAKCFPSGTICNGIAPGSHACNCPDADTMMYFGRVGMSSSTTTDELDAITVYRANDRDTFTEYHEMGDGHVWFMPRGLGSEGSRVNSFDVDGDPTHTVAAQF